MIDPITEKIKKISTRIYNELEVHEQLRTGGFVFSTENTSYRSYVAYSNATFTEDEFDYILNNLEKFLNISHEMFCTILYNHPNATDNQKMFIKLSIPNLKEY